MAKYAQAIVAFGAPAFVLGVAAITAWIALGSTQTSMGPMRLVPIAPASAPPNFALDTPPPTTLERLSPFEAEIKNSLLPFSHFPLIPGARFDPQEDRSTALQCMTAAIYYEAGQEPVAGKRAVAQVVLNRTRTAPFPRTVCGVIQQGAPKPGCQFTFMCDGSLARRPDPAGWEAARQIALLSLSGSVDPDVGSATHYHADYVLPVWAATMFKLTKIGRHIFYRWPRARLTTELEATQGVENASAALAGIGLGPAEATPAPTTREAEPTPATTLQLPAAPLLAPAPGDAADTAAPPEAKPLRAPVLRPSQPPRRAIPESSLRQGPV